MNKISAILAFTIGAMAVFAGGQVLLGKDPGYTVIGWLPVYNFSMGVLTVLVTALLLWKQSTYAMPAAIATFSAHGIVMLSLLTLYRDTVAMESIRAMTIRLIVWLLILAFMVFQGQKNKIATAS